MTVTFVDAVLALSHEDGLAWDSAQGSVDIACGALDAALAKSGSVHRIDVSDQRQAVFFVGVRVTRDE